MNIDPSNPNRPDQDIIEAPTYDELMFEMLLNTCGSHTYKDSTLNEEIVIYEYDCHCMMYEVHVLPGVYDKQEGRYIKRPKIIRVFKYVH